MVGNDFRLPSPPPENFKDEKSFHSKKVIPTGIPLEGLTTQLKPLVNGFEPKSLVVSFSYDAVQVNFDSFNMRHKIKQKRCHSNEA